MDRLVRRAGAAMSAVIVVAFPVFAVIAIGYAAGWLKLAEASDAAALNRFVFRFGFPAALFALMSSATGLGRKDALLALSYGVPAVVLMGVSYVVGRRIFSLDGEDAGAHAFASILGNAVFLGLPIALGVEGWARPFVTLMLVEGIVIISLGALVMAPRAAAGRDLVFRALTMPLKSPLVVSALAGFAFALSGLTLPAPVRDVLDLLARAAGPVALFSLGLFFATRARIDLKAHGGKIAAIAAFKMALLPAFALAASQALGVSDPRYQGALALFTATPTAAGAYVIASQYGRYVDETVSAVAATTALSLVTITAALIVFS
jgi:predicted permease